MYERGSQGDKTVESPESSKEPIAVDPFPRPEQRLRTGTADVKSWHRMPGAPLCAVRCALLPSLCIRAQKSMLAYTLRHPVLLMLTLESDLVLQVAATEPRTSRSDAVQRRRRSQVEHQ
jgi:hypothetical protein